MNKKKNISINLKNIFFNKKSGLFILKSSSSLSKIDNQISIFVKKYEKNKKLKKYYKNLNVKDIEFHNYDNTMLQYCFDVLDKKIPNENTKWFKKYYNLMCLGVLNKNDYKNNRKILNFFLQKKLIHLKEELIKDFKKNKRKNFFLKKDWLFFKMIDKPQLKKKILMFFKNLFLKNNYYRIIPVVNSIKKRGWIERKSFEPHGSVLYLYNKKYMILTGRHRLVALKYCYLKGYVKDVTVKFPILKGNSIIRNLNLN